MVREYRTFRFIPRIAMPGDGSHYSGYMVCTTATVKSSEEYSDLLDFIEGPFWAKEGVYWMGNDNQDIVRLPTSPVD